MPAATWRQDGQCPQPWLSHSSADAKDRAATDRPDPGGPVNSHACVMPPARRSPPVAAATAACSWPTAASWPISSLKTAPVIGSQSLIAGKLPVVSSAVSGTGSGSSSRMWAWISRLRSPGGRVASRTR